LFNQSGRPFHQAAMASLGVSPAYHRATATATYEHLHADATVLVDRGLGPQVAIASPAPFKEIGHELTHYLSVKPREREQTHDLSQWSR
jgi:hypothetical protein